MWSDRVTNPRPLTYKSGALPTALRGPAHNNNKYQNSSIIINTTVELQGLEHLWDYENLFETGVVRATESLL